MATLNNLQRELQKELKNAVELDDLIGSNNMRKIGKKTVSAMKRQIRKGISPISGKKFPAYKNPKRYPGRRKRHSPVNLRLEGDFLRDLKVTDIFLGKNPFFTIGFGSRESDKKEQGHREGANGQPKRPIIPIRGESFSRAVLKEMLFEVQKLLAK